MGRVIESNQSGSLRPSKLATLATAVRTEASSTIRDTRTEAQRIHNEHIKPGIDAKKAGKNWFAKKDNGKIKEARLSGKIDTNSSSTKESAKKDGPLEPKSIGLTLTRIEPIDAAKVSFFTSLAISIALTVAVTVFWLLLDTTGIIFQFTQVIIGSGIGVDISGAFSTGKVFLIMVILSCLNIALWTAMGAVMASIYNVAAQLTGGYKLRFTHR